MRRGLLGGRMRCGAQARQGLGYAKNQILHALARDRGNLVEFAQ